MAPRQHGEVSGEERVALKVLVTGASGFIGTRLLPLLVARGHEAIATSRTPVEFGGASWRLSPELGTGSDWSRTLQDAEAVVHLAGRAQIGPESESEEDLCRRIHTEATARLARQAADSGVRHFLFLSSVHAVAAESDGIITAKTIPRPSSAYGRSKLAAEQAIQQELAVSACAWTIFRPPLVYGLNNKANFGLLLKLVKSGLPLPLASVRNRRSFIYVENLTDLIVTCLGNQTVFGKTYLASDGEDVSTPELIRRIAKANANGVEQGAGSRERGDGVACGGNRGLARRSLGKRVAGGARLFHFPPSLLKAAGRLPGLGALRKLTSSLYVDSEPLCRELGWKPPFSMDEGLRQTF